VDDATAAAQTREKAANVGIDIDKLDAAVTPLQADFRTYQAQRKGAEDAIALLQKQVADLELTWKGAQQNIEEEKKVIATIAGPGANSGTPAGNTAAQSGGDQANLPAVPVKLTTIADRAAELKVRVAEARGLREKAATELQEAIRNFDLAGREGDSVRTDFSEQLQGDRVAPNEKLALQQMEETYSGSSARLAKAMAQQALAMNYAAEAMVANQLKQALTSAQEALGTDSPAAIADCLSATPSVDTIANQADEQFALALDGLEAQGTQTLPGPAAQSRKLSALVGKMIAAYGAKQLSLAWGNHPVTGKTPDDLQAMIDDLAKQVSDIDASNLPAIPYTIAVPPPAAAVPAAAPAAGATTQQ